MQNLMLAFVGLVVVGVFLQAVLLAAMFMQLKRTSQILGKVAEELQQRALPILSKVSGLIDDAQPRVSSILADSAEITRLARTQVQRVDHVLSDAEDRLRLQLVHADQILNGALDSVEDAGARIRSSLTSALRPLQAVVAVVRGIQTGINFYRGTDRDGVNKTTEDESLFI